MGQHQKHAKLLKPNVGKWGRNEIGLLGTNCPKIKKLAQNISASLLSKYTISFIDAEHKNEHRPKEKNANVEHFSSVFTDKIEYINIDFQTGLPIDENQKHLFFNHDLVLVNSNHFEATHQFVIIDPKKEASLRKRKDRLNAVIALIKTEEGNIPDYIKELLPNYHQIPTFNYTDESTIISFVEKWVVERNAPLNGLVLGGGHSRRMGKDKVLLEYNGLPQHEHLTKLLPHFCSNVFVSCRSEQAAMFASPLEDTFVNLGPMGGILSAFRHNPNTAWLTVACDVPLIDHDLLQILTKNRNIAKVATCFYNPETDFPEPLITIWEPRAYPILLNYLYLGYSCPRKVLINNDIELIELEDAHKLLNVNSPADMEMLKGMLKT